MGSPTSSSPPKLNLDLGRDFLTLFLTFVARVTGGSSGSPPSFDGSGEVGRVRPADFAFVRLKMTGDVESISSHEST